MSPEGLSRRELLLRSGAVAAGLTVAGGVAATAEPDTGGVVLTEGTNMSASLSPDGKWIAVDLVTGIWVLPAGGGRARRLTDDLQDATLPTWSPDGRTIVFQSYREGNFHLYAIDARGGAPRKLTSGRYDNREPVFSPTAGRSRSAATGTAATASGCSTSPPPG
ncbi:hypothetical protein GCM10029964_013270 [Kibdelosporangium lantanae]